MKENIGSCSTNSLAIRTIEEVEKAIIVPF